MTRKQARANGVKQIFMLHLQGTNPPRLLRHPALGATNDITTTDERLADWWVRQIDAEEMQRRIEFITRLSWSLAIGDVCPEDSKPHGLLYEDRVQDVDNTFLTRDLITGEIHVRSNKDLIA